MDLLPAEKWAYHADFVFLEGGASRALWDLSVTPNFLDIPKTCATIQDACRHRGVTKSTEKVPREPQSTQRR